MNKQEKKKISDALKEIYKRKGDEILQSKKVVLACLKDEIPDMEKKIINLLGFAMDCDVFSVIQKAKEKQISQSVLSVAKKMEDDYGADYQMSLDIVDTIAIFYGKSNGETEYCKQSETAPVVKAQSEKEKTAEPAKPSATAQPKPTDVLERQSSTSANPGRTHIYHTKTGIAKGEFSLPYCLISTIVTLLIFGLDILVYHRLGNIPAGSHGLTIFLACFLAAVVLARSVIMLIKVQDHPCEDRFTIWELCLWVVSLIGGIALFITLWTSGFSGSGWIYVLALAEFAMVVISGWVYFHKAFGWGVVDGELSAPYFAVSGGITLGILLLDVLAYFCLYQWELTGEPLWRSILFQVFLVVLAGMVFVRSIILLVKACNCPYSDKFTIGELFFWIGSMLGLGALLFLLMNCPFYHGGWSYVFVVVELLMVVISGWRYFHEAFDWVNYTAGGVVSFLLLCAFVLFLLVNNLVAADYIETEYDPMTGVLLTSCSNVGSYFSNIGIFLKSIGIFIAQVVLLLIGGGFWLARFFENLLLSGPMLNVILYALLGIFVTMACLEEK